jgi:hypothetical protein
MTSPWAGGYVHEKKKMTPHDMFGLGLALLTRKIIKKSDCCLLGRGAMIRAIFASHEILKRLRFLFLHQVSPIYIWY